ncbi:MAG: tripartite tricarboxylate transporter substrate binding protein, partial [Burkholderiales bacterium]
LLAPRGAPAAAIKRIHKEVAKLLETAEVKAAFDRVGTYAVATDPRHFRDYLKDELAKWGKVGREVNLQIN